MNLNKSHIKMLYEVMKFKDDKNLIYLHIRNNAMFNSIHFHVHEQDLYKRTFPGDIGSMYLRERHLYSIINHINCDNNYYDSINFNLIKDI